VDPRLTAGDHPSPAALAIAGALFFMSSLPAGGAVDPEACLEHLDAAAAEVDGGLVLGRVFWDGEIIEPVLIRKVGEGESDGPGFRFRDCSTGLPLEHPVAEADLQPFNSALVARFDRERTEGLKMYEEVPFLGFKEKGEAGLLFRGAGGMLEARRLDDDHVEVTGTSAVQILSEGGGSQRFEVAVLLVASSNAMRSMEPAVWDESWGDKEEDTLIDREIIWWEITGPGQLRIHPAVSSFEGLTSQLAESAAGGTEDWNPVISRNLRPILDRAALALVVAESPEHVELAEGMLLKANQANSYAVLDVASLEDRWSKDEHARLEGAASRGRNWLLIRLYDLAAIMPGRIAGKIRLAYYQAARERSPAGSLDPRFAKDYLTLTKDPGDFQVANAVYQDQAAGMARMMRFLGCLLGDARERFGSPDRLEILMEGLERMGVPSESLAGMDVGKAFQYLFQGFSLPAGLRARERDFLSSVSGSDPEVLKLVRTLQSSFGTASLEPRAACEVALIPDDVLLGRPVDEMPLTVVESRPRSEVLIASTSRPRTEEPPGALVTLEPRDTDIERPTGTITRLPEPDRPTTQVGVETVVDAAEATEPATTSVVASLEPSEALVQQAREAQERARIALTDAITAMGSRHTERKIRNGHEHSDRGNALLRSGRDPQALREAIQAFEKAEEIYLDAKEVSWHKEHSKPKLRVH
jgi:hypothetical protein